MLLSEETRRREGFGVGIASTKHCTSSVPFDKLTYNSHSRDNVDHYPEQGI